MRAWLLALWLSSALAQPEALPSMEAIAEPPLNAPLQDEAAIDAETQRISELLRCPVCQGLSVADSQEGLSLAMKARVRELVAEGYSQEQILDYFEQRYGENIILLPDQRHYLIWLAPLLAAAAGITGIVLYQRRRSAPSAPAPTPAKAGEDSGEDDEYRRRVLADLEER